MLKLNDNLKIAVEASLKAGAAIMDVYNKDFEVEIKDDKSPLTEADKRANDIINSYLKKTGIPIISEENKQLAFDTRKTWKKCWIVDPVDGTKEFVKRNGEFTVNIALAVEGEPRLGVIFVPVTKMLYIGDVDKKRSYKCEVLDFIFNYDDLMSTVERLQPKKDSGDLIVVGSRSHMNDKTSDFINNLEVEGKNVSVVSRGSSLKFCLVAEGKANVYPRFAPTMEWDTAAGDAICKAVGVQVISQETNEPLKYNKENLLNPEFIVS